MNFRDWLETARPYPAMPDDPELNGLIRGLAHYKPPQKRPGTRTSRKIQKLFGKKVEESSKSTGAGFVFTDGKSILLLLRSPHSGNPNTWGLPAGHAKENETPLKTAIREAKEEIGKIKGDTFYKTTERNGRWVFFFNKVDKPFQCQLNAEHDQWEWVNFEDLDDKRLHPKLKKKIDNYVEQIKKRVAE